MKIICKNCNQNFKGHFCNNCGQSAETHKMNFHLLQHDIQEGLFHFEKGIPFTIKQLFTRPGHSIREFLEGKRVQHFKPFSLVILLATVHGLLYHYFHINKFSINSFSAQSAKDLIGRFGEWTVTHYALFVLLSLPIYSLGTYLLFKKQKYNFIEHLVINAFVAGQKLFIGLVFFSLIYIYNETPTLSTINSLLGILSFILFVWTFCQLFNNLSRINIFFRIILCYVIFMVVMMLILFLSAAVLGIGLTIGAKPI